METTINFIPIDYDYFDFNGKNCIKIIGRTEEGKRICILDEFEPYFWAILKQETSDKKMREIQEKINKLEIKSDTRTTKVEKTEICDKKFLGKDVKAIKIFVTNYKDAHAIADQIDFPEIEFRREYDISLITRYITEKNLVPLTWKKITGEVLNNSEEFGGIDQVLEVDKVIKLKEIRELEKQLEFSPKIIAFDIEADEFEIGKGEILMISLAGKNFKKVLTWKSQETKKELDYLEYYKNEEEMLEAFVKTINKESPDILVGYFSDGFDMPYIKARAEKLGVKLALGLDGSKPTFSRGKITSSSIFGIVHVDIFRFIDTVFSQYLQSETLGLNEVALEFLGEGKKEFEFKKSSKIKEHEWKDFFEYNLQDSLLTYKLMEKLWADLLELSKIIQEPPFDITRSGMSQLVEDYILHNLKNFNEIAEKRPIHEEIENRRSLGKYEGAFVFQPKPGIYENVVLFDFTSMYSSVIVTFNLSKSTYLGNVQLKANKDFREASEADLGEEGKAYFSTKPGFFPTMLKEMVEKRKKYKAEYKKNENNLTKARSNSYKLLANAAYGYQGFFGARYYSRESAAATAALARKAILETIEKIKKESFEVIYSDTDSIAFLQENKTKKETLEFLEKLNKNMPGIMELELEDFYKRGIWVMKRDGESGAKKKYALIDDKDKLKIRGFETVRRDWCDLARDLQSKVLESILKTGNENQALEIVKKTIKELKERKITREQIRIRTQLKKPLSEYKSITPHVIAAQKMKEKGIPLDIGMTLEYFIAETREKKSLVREKVKLMDEKGEYNLKHYLEHQIIPAVENIFQVFNINIKELAEGSKQTKLF
jgi:DNA polymerase elongation subunit (family B)